MALVSMSRLVMMIVAVVTGITSGFFLMMLCQPIQVIKNSDAYMKRCNFTGVINIRCSKLRDLAINVSVNVVNRKSSMDRFFVIVCRLAVSANRVTKKYCRPTSMALTHGICPETIVVFPSVQSTVGIVV